MSKWAAALAAFLLAPSLPAAAAEAQALPPVDGPLTITRAVELAMEHSPEIKLAGQQFARASGALRSARGATGPSLGVSGTYIRYDKVEEAEIGPGQKIKIGQIDARRATATLRQPVDISGILGAAVEAADYQKIAAELDLISARYDVALAVQSAYLAVLRARDAREVSREEVQSLKTYLELAKARYEAGTAAQFDVLRAQTQLAAAEQRLISAENAVRLAEVGLASVIGVTLPPSLELQPPPDVRAEAPDPQDAVEAAVKGRPEVASAEAAVRAAERGVHIARAGLRPSLQVAANYNYNGNTTIFQPRTFTADAVVSVSIPIFDNGVTRGKVEEAEAGVEAARARRERVLLNVRQEVEQAISSVENARKRLEVAEATLKEASEAFRLAKVRYESGVGLLVETTDAQVAYTAAQTNVVSAKYDLYLAQIQLARALGLPPLAEE
ncbi:MAG: TolC family protein [Armatimonadota bacterium]